MDNNYILGGASPDVGWGLNLAGFVSSFPSQCYCPLDQSVQTQPTLARATSPLLPISPVVTAQQLYHNKNDPVLLCINPLFCHNPELSTESNITDLTEKYNHLLLRTQTVPCKSHEGFTSEDQPWQCIHSWRHENTHRPLSYFARNNDFQSTWRINILSFPLRPWWKENAVICQRHKSSHLPCSSAATQNNQQIRGAAPTGNHSNKPAVPFRNNSWLCFSNGEAPSQAVTPRSSAAVSRGWKSAVKSA